VVNSDLAYVIMLEDFTLESFNALSVLANWLLESVKHETFHALYLFSKLGGAN